MTSWQASPPPSAPRERREPNKREAQRIEKLQEKMRAIGEAVDGNAHYAALNARDELANYLAAAVVEVRGSAEVRADDKNIAAQASDGLYRTDHHLATLRSRELTQAAKDIAADIGLEHRPVAAGQRVAGIYRRSVMVASGRYAMLDDGMGFCLCRGSR